MHSFTLKLKRSLKEAAETKKDDDQEVETLLAMQVGGQPIAAEAPPSVSDNLPPVRSSPRLAGRAAADSTSRIPGNLS
ncbi:hypothetical protein SLA2020_328580 [Shorea laevis]